MEQLRAEAFRALDRVGAAEHGQWEEWTGRAFHLRRRLTSEEALHVGPVVDVRDTPEQTARFEAMRIVLPPGLADRLGPL